MHATRRIEFARKFMKEMPPISLPEQRTADEMQCPVAGVQLADEMSGGCKLGLYLTVLIWSTSTFKHC